MIESDEVEEARKRSSLLERLNEVLKGASMREIALAIQELERSKAQRDKLDAIRK